jgi:hypothetical protein
MFVSGLICNVPELEVYKDGEPISRDYFTQPGRLFALSCDPQGKKGGSGGKRVRRIFPRVMPPWVIKASLLVVPEPITEDIFLRHARTAGMFDGMGSFRIANGGPNGMWRPESLLFKDFDF